MDADANADANANANANANADAGGSTIALRELCSGELKIALSRYVSISKIGPQYAIKRIQPQFILFILFLKS